MEYVDIILYVLLFCMGTVFGSFFTLAVYRIPLRQDITHTRSYCPNCNHKLSFFDMIPILSYTFLGGRCRYCSIPIRPRYLLLELLSGIVFMLFGLSIKLSMFTFTPSAVSYTVMGLLYISTLFIIAGIDKEKIKIEKPLLLFGFICSALYITYLYIVEPSTNMYRYIIYLAMACVLLLIHTFYLRKKTKNSYIIDILLLSIFMIMFTYEINYIFTAIITLTAIIIQVIISKIKNKDSKTVKKDKNKECKIPIGFYLCTANIIVMLITNLYIFYR